MKEQICTNIEQSKKLMELGLREDTADLYITMKGKNIVSINMAKSKEGFPSWSLAKLVEIVKHYPTHHPEVWFDIHFFDEIFNEVCHALVDGYCWDYWSDEKRKREKDPKRNKWSKFAKEIKAKLPKRFAGKWPDRSDLIDFFDSEGNNIKHRDDRLGCIYRTAAEELKAYDEKLRKPRLMLQWSRNDYGYHHLSAWALSDEGYGCYEYACVVGVNKLSALWKLVRQMKRQGHLHLLRYIVEQNTVSDIPGRVKRFKIEELTESYYIIRQRHTLLFFLHWYDQGSDLLAPYYRQRSRLEARDLIAKTCREKGFDYRIKDVYKKK